LGQKREIFDVREERNISLLGFFYAGDAGYNRPRVPEEFAANELGDFFEI
jgi:hypothetical protein